MGAGNVIHALDDEQDMRRYGGLGGSCASPRLLPDRLAVAGRRDPARRLLLQGADPWRAFSKPDTRWRWSSGAIGFVTALITGVLHRPHVVDRLLGQAVGRAASRAPARGAAGHAGARRDPAALTVRRRLHPDAALGFGPWAVDGFPGPRGGAQRWEESAGVVVLGLAHDAPRCGLLPRRPPCRVRAPGAQRVPGPSACWSTNTTSTRSTTASSCGRWTVSRTSALRGVELPCSTARRSGPAWSRRPARARLPHAERLLPQLRAGLRRRRRAGRVVILREGERVTADRHLAAVHSPARCSSRFCRRTPPSGPARSSRPRSSG